ncbi:MAG: phenylalanine--tRNA ligase subunit beta [Bacilli bacterium]|nr:phenylalanine--tRNA ligase subunit beta [Bacilli bacterium]
MRVSYKWLKELVDIKDVSYEQLTSDFNAHIVEIDALSKLTEGTNIIVAKVLECVDHPDSDHLHITKVDTGSDVLQVVCGAPNVKAGQKVMLALPGAVLPGGTIKKGVIRGVESNGMICSLQEVNLDSKYIPEEYKNGIYVLSEDAPLGVNALEYLGLDDDIIELGLTPNRMDLLSMYGVANDVAAYYGTEVYKENSNLVESNKKTSEEVSVKIDTPNCLSYNARVIKNVTIKESPEFIKTRLMASGIRCINNVVDITNYILVLFGQPLHAFDQDKLGNSIVVRNAFENEKIVTLDDIERTLQPTDVVITNGQEIGCIGGVMGCSNTEVTNDTKNIVLEAAVFNLLSVRKTSARLGLRSESSVRFERGVDLNQTVDALNYAAYLLQRYADGTVLKDVVHEGVEKIDDKVIELSLQDVKKYLGIEIEKETFERILTNLGFGLDEFEENNYNVIVPNRRMDISIKADLIEELARMHGYDNLKMTLPAMQHVGELTVAQKRINLIRTTLSTLGLNEVVTYALVSKDYNQRFTTLHKPNQEEIELMHPMSEERSVLRKGLIPSILDVACYNSARKLTDLALFEIGSRYYKEQDSTKEEVVLSGLFSGKFNGNNWQGGRETVDFYLVKGIIENLVDHLGIQVKYQKMTNVDKDLHPGRCAEIKFQNEVVGYISALHPACQHDLDLQDTYVFEIVLTKILNSKSTITKFQSLVKKPTVVRDLALVMEKDVPVGDLIEAIQRTSKDCISKVEVFDLYESVQLGSKKSVAISIYFESDDNLTDEVISSKVNKILEMAESKYKATLRA